MDVTALTHLKNRHLPPEVVEEILLNLPIKSLVRFTTVSKSWYSLILEPRFTKKHKSRAVLLHRESLVIYINFNTYEVATLSALSSISTSKSDLLSNKIFLESKWSSDTILFSFVSNGSARNMTDFAGQFEKKPYLRAHCDELWCVQVGGNLFLWNPCMRNYRKLLPDPLFKSAFPYRYSQEFVYGLGYDYVGDEYKILKVGYIQSELYSLKSNCWVQFESYSSAEPSYDQDKCAFVGGRFHWIGVTTAKTPVIVSFNLSTEKYGEVALPPYSPALKAIFLDDDDGRDIMELVVLRGMLCVWLMNTVNNITDRYVLWMMEEYGVEKSWTKKFDFHDNFGDLIKPVHYYDNDSILVKIYEQYTDFIHIVLYMKEKGEMMRHNHIVCCGTYSLYYEGDAFFYVETLISPTLYN